MLRTYRRLLRSSRPVMLMTALVALFGITGTAFAAQQLITGADIKNGSITTVDLSKATQHDLQGSKGDDGDRGFKGAKGSRGAEGPVGSIGGKGDNGGAGTAGAGGPQGGAGTKGSDGAAGTNGTPGGAGPDGPQGATGPVGARGTTGAQGSTGVTGAGGPQGTTGTTGATGTTGNQGVPAVRYFANVNTNGSYVTQSGFTAAVHFAASGHYVLPLAGSPNVLACVAMAQVTGAGGGFAVAFPDQTGVVTVDTTNVDGSTSADHGFVVTVSC